MGKSGVFRGVLFAVWLFIRWGRGRAAGKEDTFAQEKYSNGETSLQLFDDWIEPNALYLMDEPEVSLSPQNQIALAEKLNDMSRFLNCQFIIATHSPFMLGTLDARIYDIDSRYEEVKKWNELDHVRFMYDFFQKHRDEF